MEADFTYTSDGVLAVRHDFEAGGSYYRLEIEPDGPLVMDSQTYREKKAVYERGAFLRPGRVNIFVETDFCRHIYRLPLGIRLRIPEQRT